jgi:hypothetical protein
MLVCFGCQWQMAPHDSEAADRRIEVSRFDRIESLYLTTGDFSAMQQMNTSYPAQTRMLIEDVLKLGHVNDPDINTKFLTYFQDSTLQQLIDETQRQYANMDDLNEQLNNAFDQLKKALPELPTPHIYAQISSFDQSIVVGDSTLGISLDKYLGANYPLYKKFGYTDRQLRTMTRAFIVPDCLSFYLLSCYPLAPDSVEQRETRMLHMGRIQWVVNTVLHQQVFNNEFVEKAAAYMKQHPKTSTEDLLTLACS